MPEKKRFTPSIELTADAISEQICRLDPSEQTKLNSLLKKGPEHICEVVKYLVDLVIGHRDEHQSLLEEDLRIFESLLEETKAEAIECERKLEIKKVVNRRVKEIIEQKNHAETKLRRSLSHRFLPERDKAVYDMKEAGKSWGQIVKTIRRIPGWEKTRSGNPFSVDAARDTYERHQALLAKAQV